jgi:hypothetical protein
MPQMKTRRMRIACWILKATNTGLPYAILTAARPQQRLHERVSTLRLRLSPVLITFIICFMITTE